MSTRKDKTPMKNNVFRTIIRFITFFRVARWRVIAYPCKTPYSSLLAMQKALKNKEPVVIGASQIQTRKSLEFIASRVVLRWLAPASIAVGGGRCLIK